MNCSPTAPTPTVFKPPGTNTFLPPPSPVSPCKYNNHHQTISHVGSLTTTIYLSLTRKAPPAFSIPTLPNTAKACQKFFLLLAINLSASSPTRAIPTPAMNSLTKKSLTRQIFLISNGLASSVQLKSKYNYLPPKKLTGSLFKLSTIMPPVSSSPANSPSTVLTPKTNGQV